MSPGCPVRTRANRGCCSVNDCSGTCRGFSGTGLGAVRRCVFCRCYFAACMLGGGSRALGLYGGNVRGCPGSATFLVLTVHTSISARGFARTLRCTGDVVTGGSVGGGSDVCSCCNLTLTNGGRFSRTLRRCGGTLRMGGRSFGPCRCVSRTCGNVNGRSGTVRFTRTCVSGGPGISPSSCMGVTRVCGTGTRGNNSRGRTGISGTVGMCGDFTRGCPRLGTCTRLRTTGITFRGRLSSGTLTGCRLIVGRLRDGRCSRSRGNCLVRTCGGTNCVC